MTNEELIILARFVDMREKLDTFDLAALRKLESHYNTLIADLEDRITSVKLPKSRARKEAILAEIKVEVAAIVESVSVLSGQGIGSSAEWSYEQINAIVSWDGKTPGWNNLTLTAAQLTQLVTEQKLGDKLLRDWIGSALLPDIDSIIKESIAGQIAGESYAIIIRRLQAELQLSPKNKRDLAAVVRTYVHSMNVKAAQDIYEQNKEIVRNVEWSAIMESGNVKTGKGTCPRCMALDGMSWRTDDYSRPVCPLHVSCRCLLLPGTVSWAELGFNIPEMEKGYEPWIIRAQDNKLLDYGFTDQNYRQWWATRSKAFQDNAVGPIRAGLIRDNVVDFEDIVDSKGNLLTIKELLAKG